MGNPRARKKIYISKRAQQDVLDAVEYLKLESPVAAEKFKSALLDKIGTLSMFPSRGRHVPELRDLHLLQYRDLIVGRYRVIYKVLADTIRIMRVLHARRKFPGPL